MKKHDLHSTALERKFHQDLLNGVLEIDNSTFMKLDACDVKGFFGGVLKMQPTRSALPLKFGDAVHAGMEAHLRGESQQDVIDTALARAEHNGLALVADDRRNLSSLVTLFESYFLDYRLRPEKFDPVVLDGKPMIEQSFALPLGTLKFQGKDITVVWTGKIDLVSWWNTKTQLVGVDHKTTSVMGAQFTDTMERSSQFLGYLWALGNVSKSLSVPLAGFILNTVAIRKTGFEFKLFSLPYPSWQVEEWKLTTLGKLQQFLTSYEQYLETGFLVPTRESCCTKYGKCEFFSVCQSPPRIRGAALLDSPDFELSTWSPLNEN